MEETKGRVVSQRDGWFWLEVWNHGRMFPSEMGTIKAGLGTQTHTQTQT